MPLCEAVGCLIALRCLVQRGIIIVLPSLLMDMRLAKPLKAGCCVQLNGEGSLELVVWSLF